MTVALRQPDYRCEAAVVICEACERETEAYYWDHTRRLLVCKACCPSVDGPVVIDKESKWEPK